MKGYFIKTIVFSLILLLSIPAFSQLKNAIRLKVSSGSYSDETVVRFLEGATDAFDSDWDAYKLRNGGNTPNFYSFWNSESYAISAFNMPYSEKEVPLYLEVAFTGTYTITPQILGAFDSSSSITLIDKVLNTTTDLKGLNSYIFDFVQGNPRDRFLIKFLQNGSQQNFTGLTSITYHEQNEFVNIKSVDSRIMIDFKDVKEKISIGVFDGKGAEICSEENIDISTPDFSWLSKSEARGLNIVIIEIGNKSYSGKIFIEN